MVRRHGPRVALTARAVLTAILVSASALLAGSAGAQAATRPQQVSPPPQAFIVVEADSGEVLSGENTHEAIPPASTAKVMTAVTAVERVPPEATIAVSELAAAQPASRINMVAGHQWTFRDAMASMMMASANDAAYAIAETAGGTLQGFAEAMAQTGERLGMRDSTFADPAGLDNEGSFAGGPRMSAFDIAVATRNALAVPEISSWAALSTYEFVDPADAPRSLTNHNKMLPGHSLGYEGATGFKTGYTDRAGHTLVATATRDGCSLIVVVLNTWDTYGWATALLDQTFAAGCEGGGGEQLPDVAVSPYAQRVADLEAFVGLARGTDGAGPSVAATGAAPSSIAPTSSTTPEEVVGEAAPIVNQQAVDQERSDGPGLFRPRNVALAVLVLLASAFVLRRRAVRRRRARRLAARRRRAALMRSGGLPVVDGRYRTGTREGPPLESHVRVRSVRDDD